VTSADPSAVVVGGGVIGAACARALADAGARVRVLDAGAGRASASWAAAGILAPGKPYLLPEPVHALAARSLDLWAEIAARHPRLELRAPGTLLLGDEPSWVAWRRARGLACEPTEWRGRAAVRFPETAVLRPNRAAAALLADLTVERAQVEPDGLARLRSEHDIVVLAGGAWAQPLLADAGLDLAVAPRRGQMLLFDAGDPPGILLSADGDELALPRADGRVLVGTTLEDAGFDASTDAETLDSLEAWARAEVPGLGRRIDSWAGFRPWSPRPAPTIGRLAPGLLAAVGHFRNGLLLAPGTGELIADLALRRPTRVNPEGFAP
jgi:glycine oxidase